MGKRPIKIYRLILLVLISLFLTHIPAVFAQSAAEFVHLGNVCGKQGKYKEAILDYSNAIKAVPHFANAFYNRSYVYIELKKYKLAIDDLENAIEFNPKYAAAYHLLGITYFIKKKYPLAIAAYNKAIELDPDNLKYYYSRLSAYFKMGNNDKAWKDVIKIQSLGGTVNPIIINLLKDKKYRE